MKIVIVGGGKVGETICGELSDSQDIVLIDNDPQVIENIFSQYDIQAVVGNGANVNVQMEATVADSDIFLAVTNSDELNIVSSIIAKKLGAKYTIARVRNPEYHMSVDFIKTSLGITSMINPEEESAEVISEILKFPTAQGIESFAGGEVNIVEITVEADSFIKDMTLRDFGESFQGRLLVCIVERGDDVFIPKGDTRIKENDKIYVTGNYEDLDRFYTSLRKYNEPVKSVLIVGGGRLAYYLTKKLLKRKVDVKIIEIDRQSAEELSREFPEIIVVSADGTDQDILEDEGISEYDACIALTGIDEENIIISIYAKHMNVKKAIAKVNRTSMLKILDHVGLDTIITPKGIIADKIIRFVRSISSTSDSAVQKLYKLADRRVEAMEFEAGKTFKGQNIRLAELNILDNTIIAIIFRDGELIFPGGNDKIMPKDRVVLVTTHKNIIDLDDIVIE
ncbi:MAG: Trk system potassium transporter TrkA [Tissierellia bacterium]|nr:Trk system potassium transporter TrkA [Tissierellia bacterium]